MIWYKRLFWKIFAAIWLVSLLALVATVVWIGSVAEKDKFEQIMNARATAYAEVMIERYERQGQQTLLPFRPPPRRFFDRDEDDDDDDDHAEERREKFREWRRKSHHRLPSIVDRVQIIDLNSGRKVVGPGQFSPDPKTLQQFNTESESGHPYQVQLDLNWKQSPFGGLARALVSIQLIWIMLVSGLGALLISAIIVRPLNRLRAHTQALSQGELDSRTDQALNRRGDELGELAREFDRMADYVEQTLTNNQKLLQDVSHELRAPLARLQAAAGLAEQRLGENDPLVSRINRECERLDQLIGELLTLSRLEQMEAPSEPWRLSELLKDLIEDHRFAHPNRTFNLAIDSDCQLRANPKLLLRALNNILGNACKHTPDSATVDLAVTHDKAQCHITIRDHGPGVQEHDLDQLCKPFYRGDASHNGYGLGLSIAQRAVDRLGGHMNLRNHPQSGLEVSITLPMH